MCLSLGVESYLDLVYADHRIVSMGARRQSWRDTHGRFKVR
jgi:hypothetical protein